jgi:hypothetical protein
LDTLNLPEGKAVTVTMLDVPSACDVGALRRSAGGCKDLIDAEELIKNTDADRLISTRPESRLY